MASGFIREEKNGVTGEVTAPLNTSVENRTVCYTNGRTEHLYFPAFLGEDIKEYIDGPGRKTIYNYDMGGNGFII
ncbi:MAG: hypothetical protein WKG06_47255 [Segetibacter sp.]